MSRRAAKEINASFKGIEVFLNNSSSDKCDDSLDEKDGGFSMLCSKFTGVDGWWLYTFALWYHAPHAASYHLLGVAEIYIYIIAFFADNVCNLQLKSIPE